MGSHRKTLAAVFAYVTPDDRVRLKRIAVSRCVSVSKLLRELINDGLEDMHEPVLTDIREAGRPRSDPDWTV
jgi:hypothetical protein